MTPAVSVVIAAYNYGRFLGGALESVLGQTYGDFEAIVIDDGSTDNTHETVRSHLRDKRVRYIRTDHIGQPRAKNAGIQIARAPLIAFLDADDIWLPGKLERQVAVFSSDPDLGVVYTRRLLINEDGIQLHYQEPELYRGNVLEPMFLWNFICFSSAMVTRRALQETGLFDESLALAIDYDLWLRIAARFRFDFVNEPLVQYRVGHANLSRRVEERLTTVCQIMERFLYERGGCGLLNARVIRRAWAETCYHLALEKRSRSRWHALPLYIKSLAYSPGFILAWQGLASLLLPETGRRCLRRLLGRPIDWRVRAALRSTRPRDTS